MKNDARFEKLKKQVGGNREIAGFEYTFGIPREMAAGITPPGKWNRRILSEIEFALKLDKYGENPGEFSQTVGQALTVLEKAMERDGVLTDGACREAEEALSVLRTKAKEYALILCGHAHIDMNWMWSYNETVAATLSTFGTMLALMDQYPEFTFSQSQTSVYRIVEENDPEMMERIKARIREGRWEVTASEWVETDKNMPTGESLIHSTQYSLDYLENTWGVDPDSLCIDFSPDTFGHSRFVPEIDRYCGVKYCYHCRGLDEAYTLYRYKAPSGREILSYSEPYWYNSAITPHIGVGLPALTHKMGGLKTGLVVYGVGNHGGGVTRRDIEKAYEMMEWPVFPSIRFGTFGEFFRLADVPEIREKLPVVDHELNFLFDGCYTTQSRIKKANRMAEAKLTEAQAMSVFSKISAGGQYRDKAFAEAWENVLFTHFHDILTGSCVQDSREYAMGLYQRALATAETEESKALRKLSDLIDCSGVTVQEEEDPRTLNQSFGAGVGYGIAGFGGVPNPERGVGLTRVFHVFNTAPEEKTGLTEITVWDWAGDLARVAVTDEAGNPLEAVLKDGTLQHYWDHKFVRFIVKCTIPAYGYTTVVFRQRETEEYPFRSYVPDWGRIFCENDCVLENEYLRAEFDLLTMNLVSLVDKTDGSEKIRKGGFAGLEWIETQDNGMTAWTVGRYLAKHPITDISAVGRGGLGDLQSVISFNAKVLNSSIHCDISLDKGAKALQYHVAADWNELSGATLPVLAFEIPVGYEASQAENDVPMGAARRAPANHDIPGLTYCRAIPKDGDNSGSDLGLLTDSKYGYRFFDGSLISTLINTAHNPDPAPERGHHEISLYVGLFKGTQKDAEVLSGEILKPFRCVPTNPHPGCLPAKGAFLTGDFGSAVLRSVTEEKGKLRLRLNEVNGETARVSVKFLKPVKTARVTDLRGNIFENIAVRLAPDGSVLTEVPPYSVVTLEITL